MEDQAARERLARIVETPEVQRAMQQLSVGLSKGLMEGLSQQNVDAYVRGLAKDFAREMVAEILREMGTVTPAMATSFVHGLAEEIPRSLGPAMRQAFIDDLGPALREVMQKDVAPGAVAMLSSPEMQAALGASAREVAHQVVLGSNDGLAELETKQKHDRSGAPLGVLGAFFAPRLWLAGLLAATVVFSIPLAWLVRERRKSRLLSEERERRRARAETLLLAIESNDKGAPSAELLDLLRQQLVADTRPTKVEDESPHDGLNLPREHHA